MATLILTAVGTLVGGPIGGAIGALAGRSIDGAIIGGGSREGPRLKELGITTSSYGQPIPRHHGRMRAAGTVIWATDLVEHADRTGGKKGRPSVTSYSYSISFAVALSSRAIRGVGRIWADGNLLRGEAGDLKVGGLLRVHLGCGDEQPDPLISAAQGANACPAFRDCAYAVFEDLALEEFGNRIPALTFEVIADDGAVSLADLVGPLGDGLAVSGGALPALAGFAYEGGPVSATLATVDSLYPLACDAGGNRLTIGLQAPPLASPPLLPEPARGWADDDDGHEPGDHGAREIREDANDRRPDALRYYDLDRDYQPGVQRSGGRAFGGRAGTIEFPGTLVADDARALAEQAARRSAWRRDTLSWRVAELDPALTPGADVRVPGRPGVWRIEGWEWRSRGIELELVRLNPRTIAALPGDPGSVVPPRDLAAAPTALAFFEAPPISTDPGEPVRFAAATAAGDGKWSGAALYAERAGALVPIGGSGRERATIGTLLVAMPPSAGMLFERDATIDLALVDPEGMFANTTLAALTGGANRLLVGGEVVQFVLADELGAGRWRLSGLMRGRGGTEPAALAGHSPGTYAVLLDDALVALDPALVPGEPGAIIAAAGAGDAEPVEAVLANAGAGTRPPCPVHPVALEEKDGALTLAWTRRARGAWRWHDEVDAPLVEEVEAYRVGLGPVDAPVREWRCDRPRLIIGGDERTTLAAAHPGEEFWVRQIGRAAQSDPLHLFRLA